MTVEPWGTFIMISSSWRVTWRVQCLGTPKAADLRKLMDLIGKNLDVIESAPADQSLPLDNTGFTDVPTEADVTPKSPDHRPTP